MSTSLLRDYSPRKREATSPLLPRLSTKRTTTHSHSTTTYERVMEAKNKLLGHSVAWLKAEEKSIFFKLAKKAITLIASAFLLVSLVGIPLFLQARTIWQKESTLASSGAGQGAIDPASFAKLSTTNREEILALAPRIQVSNPNHEKLSLSKLEEQGFLPQHKMTVGNATFYLAPPFKDRNHTHLFMLVEVDGKVWPRMAYHSNSQGTWRVFPAALKMREGGFEYLRHYDKGRFESDTELPISLTIALNRVTERKAIEKKEELHNHINSVDNAFGIGSRDFLDSVKEDRPDSAPFTKLKEGAKGHFVKGGYFVSFPEDPTAILPPPPSRCPNLSACLHQEKVKIPEYGEVTIYVFASHDKEYLYQFHEASDGRAYLAKAEKQSAKISKYGVREEAPDLKHLDAPLLEYQVQIPKGKMPELSKPGNPWENIDFYDSFKYISNWNYVRETALIQQFYQEFKRSAVPKKV